MARLLDWPLGLGLTDIQFLSGPQAVGAGSSTSLTGYTQTSASPFGAWAFQASFVPLQGALSRRHRGWITALHGGANATRYKFFDADRMRPEEAGINVPRGLGWSSLPSQNWSNGQRWSNNRGWRPSPPVVKAAALAAIGDSIVRLENTFWGHSLGYGDLIGYFPFSFGMYMVTEVITAGQYRVWPTLRAAVQTTSYFTLAPILAVRLSGPSAANAGRGPVVADNLTATFVEVFDYDVRDWFTD